MKLKRMWVNQPSKNQAFHSLHGKNVLAEDFKGLVTIYFIDGEVISQFIWSDALSRGWH